MSRDEPEVKDDVERLKGKLRQRYTETVMDQLLATVEKREREKYGRCTHGILLEVACRRCAEGKTVSRDEQIKKLAEEMALSAVGAYDPDGEISKALLPYAAESIRKDEAIAEEKERRAETVAMCAHLREAIAAKDKLLHGLAMRILQSDFYREDETRALVDVALASIRERGTE